MSDHAMLNRKLFATALLGALLGAMSIAPGAVFAAPPVKEPAAVADDKGPPLARMGDVVLTVAEFQRLMNYSNKEVKKQLLANPELLRQKIREALLRKTMLVRAKASKWDERPEVVYLMQRAKDGLLVEQFLENVAKVPADFPDEALVRKTYQENKDKLQSPPAVNVAQIFLKVEPNADEKSKQEAVKNAEKYLGWIKKGDADFSTLARKHSQHQPSATQGGDMGWVEVNQLLPEVRKALEGMKAGDVGGPVVSGQGLHVIKLIASREAATRTYEEVRESLVNLLISRRLQENKDNYLKEMVEKYPISLTEENVNHLK
ncbi:MAG: peptidylprolyl isomerase [Magnetococcales bacterium]|nr:peptidylprolyl isomerase [Magnetococcales bacterium]